MTSSNFSHTGLGAVLLLIPGLLFQTALRALETVVLSAQRDHVYTCTL